LRFIHRGIGLIFVALLVQHVARAILRALRKRQLPVMATTIQDFHDVVGTVKHFIWGTPRPKTGKFDFSEKFEYWGLFMGGTLMSATGVGLLFPELITNYLPGLVVAMFRVMHGLEATFAVLVVALWHSYGVMLRPEVFPLDTSIFTGEISKHRLEEEHRLEYERLFPEEIEEPADEVGAAD
jgi:Ni,Fe-hydrogenase I cytochrome b subunit